MNVICKNCGKQFWYEPPATVNCPFCGARYGTAKGTHLPHSRNRVIKEAALAAAGIFAGSEVYNLIFHDAGSLRRDLTVQILTDAEVFGMYNIVPQPTACDFCMQAAADGPYPLSYIWETHPHCECGIEPERTSLEVPEETYD